MKKVIYNHADYYCAIFSQQEYSVRTFENWLELIPVGKGLVNKITLAIRGGKWKILWPNREGEIFSLSKVSHVLSQYNVPEGLTLSYPATASCRTLIFTEESGKGFAFLAPPDVKGRVTEFRIKAEDSQSGSISILGISCPWYSLVFDGMDELKDKVRDLQDSVPWTKLPFRKTNSKWQVQVGLIGPEGDTNVPENRGFNVLCDVSELMQKELGENNILHIFGYSAGHDTSYPDYSPSENLGGKASLEKALAAVKDSRQKAVFYMNGRIAQKENVESENLHNSVLKDKNGNPVIEVYHQRKFYVMNPSSQEWQARLLKEARELKKLGAHGIQLDQLGGRAAPLPAGEIWGEGYIYLINNLHKEGLALWIQGLSDIYPADWFELTYRNTCILKDGIIRGGTPLGKSDKRVFQISVPDQVLLIPFSKMDAKEDYINSHIIIDLDLGIEKLFLYGKSYLGQLEKVMTKAAQSLGHNAENRVAVGINNK